tara:strand:+ start:2633 stop:2797 length:165 start_codon:yes stop_codon:yes gene_type:complete
MALREMTQEQLVKLLKRTLWDYRQCNLQSIAVRERIANEMMRDITLAIVKEQDK